MHRKLCRIQARKETHIIICNPFHTAEVRAKGTQDWIILFFQDPKYPISNVMQPWEKKTSFLKNNPTSYNNSCIRNLKTGSQAGKSFPAQLVVLVIEHKNDKTDTRHAPISRFECIIMAEFKPVKL